METRTKPELTDVSGLTSTDLWNDYSGALVEHYIKTLLDNIEKKTIKTVDISGLNVTIALNDDETVYTGEISVANPTFNYYLGLQKLEYNGEVITASSNSFQYKEGTKVYAYFALVSTTTITNTNDRLITANVIFRHGTLYVTKLILSSTRKAIWGSDDAINVDPETNNIIFNDDSVVTKIDITDLFSNVSTSGNFTIETDLAQYGESPVTYIVTGPSFSSLVLELIPESKYILTENKLNFTLRGASDISTYTLQVFNNGVGYVDNYGNTDGNPLSVTIASTGVVYSQLIPGINRIMARAVKQNTDSEDLFNGYTYYTDWVQINVLYVDSTVDYPCGVINEVPELLDNNATNSLAVLSLFNPTVNDVQVDAYLEDNGTTRTNSITSIAYTSDDFSTEVTVGSGTEAVTLGKSLSSNLYAYIEDTNTSADKYLSVVINGIEQVFYTVELDLNSLTVKSIAVSEVNPNFIRFTGYSASLNFDYSTNKNNNLFTSDNMKSIPILDGWILEDGRWVFKVGASTTPLFKSPVQLNLGTSFTIEFGIKTYNVSNEDAVIMSIGDSFQLRASLVCFNESDSDIFNNRNSEFEIGLDTFITITYNLAYKLNSKYYPNYLNCRNSKGALWLAAFDTFVNNTSYGILKIYINGVIDRTINIGEFSGSTLQINPIAADINFYTFRVFNSYALSAEEVQLDYTAYLPTKSLKETFYNANAILDNNGEISFDKARKLYNCLVYVIPKGHSFPNRAFGEPNNTDPNLVEEDLKKVGTTLFVWYADEDTNAKYGGRITNGQLKGLGSSAKRYLVWNCLYALGKLKDSSGNKIKSLFTPFSLMNKSTNTFKSGASTVANYYYIPTSSTSTTDDGLKVKKLVGKVNWASSLQSHKEGACELYNETYNTSSALSYHPQKTTSGDTTKLACRKAVKELPFLYFYIESDLEDVSNYELADVIQASPKFMGFQTWGSGKCDNATFGYDDDVTPEYILLEGGENEDYSVNFSVPWQDLQRFDASVTDTTHYELANYPTVSSIESKADSTANLRIYKESIWYINKASWDVDYGIEEYDYEKVAEYANKKDYYYFTDAAKVSLEKFRAFYDFVYLYDTDIHIATTNDISQWDTRFKYVYNGSLTVDSVAYAAGDIFRYDPINKTWVNAGRYYDSAAKNGIAGWHEYASDGETYVRANIYILTGVKSSSGLATAILYIKGTRLKDYQNGLFWQKISEFIEVNDIAHHLAVIKLLSGTDNRAKNTYFQIIGKLYEAKEVTKTIAETETYIDEETLQEATREVLKEVTTTEYVLSESGDYLIRLMGDDLDTIIKTDNSGLRTKPYNLIEPSYDDSVNAFWGDGNRNVFFRSFDQTHEAEIKNALSKVIATAFGGSSDVTNKGTNFYNWFFNVLEYFPAVAYNHTAQIYYEVGHFLFHSGATGGIYDNNSGTEPLTQSLGSSLTGERQFMSKRLPFLMSYALVTRSPLYFTAKAGTLGQTVNLKLSLVPFQDFYPSALNENNTTPLYLISGGTTYDVIDKMAKEDELVPSDSSKSLEFTFTGITQGIEDITLCKDIKMTGFANSEFKINLPHTRSLTLYDVSIGDFSPTAPALQYLSLLNVSNLPSKLDLSEFYKLTELDLTGSTGVTDLSLPITDSLKSIKLCDTITSLTLSNLTSLTTLEFTNKENLLVLSLNSLTSFDINGLLEEISDFTGLQQLTLTGNYVISEDILEALLSIPNLTINGILVVADDYDATKNVTASTNWDSSDLKQIDFNLVKKLINRNLISKVYYREVAITFFYIPSEIPGPLDVIDYISNVTGNMLVDKSGNYYLKVTKSKATNIKLTSYGLSYIDTDTTEGTYTVTLGSYSVNTLVRFTEHEPALGDFAYGDGTFSNIYVSSKDLMGLVFAINGKDVYIIGKEYVGNGKGYLGGLDYTTDTTVADANMLTAYNNATSKSKVLSSTTFTNLTIDGVPEDDNMITAESFTNTSDPWTPNYDLFVGQSKTKNLVDKLKEAALTIPSTSSDSLLTLTSLSSENIYLTLVLLPYYTATYLYEPTHTNDIFDELYSLGHWYVPSVEELSMVLLERACSATTGAFSYTNLLSGIIASDKTDYNGIVPIFSKAANTSIEIPDCWKYIGRYESVSGSYDANKCQLTCTFTSNVSPVNTKAFIKGYWSNSIPSFTTGSRNSTYGSNNAWCGNPHLSIPFVKYTRA